MDEPRDRVAELHQRALEIRVRVIESNQGVVAELRELWNDLNDLADGQPEARRVADQVASDIARLEKLDLVLDAEWLEDARRSNRESSG